MSDVNGSAPCPLTHREMVGDSPQKWPRKFEQHVKASPIGIGAHWHGEKELDIVTATYDHRIAWYEIHGADARMRSERPKRTTVAQALR